MNVSNSEKLENHEFRGGSTNYASYAVRTGADEPKWKSSFAQ